MSKLIGRMRDLILFIILLILLKVAYDRRQQDQQRIGQVLSAMIDIPEATPAEQADFQEPEPIPFIMPDMQEQPDGEPQEIAIKKDTLTIIEQLDTQIATLLSLAPATSSESAQLQSMRQRLNDLKQSYQRILALEDGKENAAIIQKGMSKEQIEDAVFKIAKLVARIIRLHAGQTEQPIEYDSVDTVIYQNENLLSDLTLRQAPDFA